MNNTSGRTDFPLELSFLRGGGEMGQRIRKFAWEGTPLGHPSTWSVSLKTAVGIMLNSGVPGYIASGSNFIQLYNDAYIAILGEQKHPHALGATTAETWHELWEFIGPLFHRVIHAGEILSFNDQLMVMQRSGYPEECYFSFSYSPLTNESGGINGVFVTAWETTDAVINRRRDTGLKMLAETLSGARDMERVNRSAFELREQQYQFESVMQAIPCLVWMSGTNMECTFFNQAWLDFRGRSLEQESNNGWAEGIHPEDLQKVENDFRTTVDKQEAFMLEYRLQRADGEYRWILDRSTPRYNMAGDFLGYIGICLDMTDSRSTTEALLNSEVRYRQIVETAQEGI